MKDRVLARDRRMVDAHVAGGGAPDGQRAVRRQGPRERAALPEGRDPRLVFSCSLAAPRSAVSSVRPSRSVPSRSPDDMFPSSRAYAMANLSCPDPGACAPTLPSRALRSAGRSARRLAQSELWTARAGKKAHAVGALSGAQPGHEMDPRRSPTLGRFETTLGRETATGRRGSVGHLFSMTWG